MHFLPLAARRLFAAAILAVSATCTSTPAYAQDDCGTSRPAYDSALVPPVASIVIHARGVRQRRYDFNGPDWAFDAAVRSGPLVATIPNPLYDVVIYTAAYASLVCWAHP